MKTTEKLTFGIIAAVAFAGGSMFQAMREDNDARASTPPIQAKVKLRSDKPNVVPAPPADALAEGEYEVIPFPAEKENTPLYEFKIKATFVPHEGETYGHTNIEIDYEPAGPERGGEALPTELCQAVGNYLANWAGGRIGNREIAERDCELASLRWWLNRKAEDLAQSNQP